MSRVPPAERLRIAKAAVEQYEGAREREFNPRYYNPLGDAIARALVTGRDLTSVEELCARQESIKRSNYEACLAGLTRWLRANRSFEVRGGAASSEWPFGRISILVNPDVDVELAGRRMWLKFYYKAPNLSMASIEPMIHLLDVATRGNRPAGSEVGVLDLRQPRIFTNRRLSRSVAFSMDDVLRSIENCWFEALRLRERSASRV